MREMFHRCNTLQTLEYLALKVHYQAFKTPPSCSMADFQSNECITSIYIPCTTPYFHKDTLTPPSSSRSPSLAGGGPSKYAARDASLYNARPLLRDLHSAP